MQRAGCFAALALATGCAIGPPAPEPLPLSGTPPRVVATWPTLAGPFQDHRQLLLGGLDAALRARGYTVVPSPVAEQLLLAAGIDSPQAAPAELGRLLAADAALQFVVADFQASGARPLREARWDVTWRLVSLRDGREQWSCSQRGHYVPPVDTRDPHRALDAEPEVVPLGGDSRIVYRDAAELIVALHRLAMAQLPARTR